jgi:hypothetical protein
MPIRMVEDEISEEISVGRSNNELQNTILSNIDIVVGCIFASASMYLLLKRNGNISPPQSLVISTYSGLVLGASIYISRVYNKTSK